MIFLRKRLLLLGLMLLSACSQYGTQPSAISPLSNKPLPEKWQIKGKLGVRSTAGNGSLSLNWQQNNNDYIIYTQAPLGQGAATLAGDDTRIVITEAGKAPVTSIAPRQLVQETFGWDLPINGFKYWVKGIPNPEQPHSNGSYDPAGNLSELQQAGWALSFSRYHRVKGWALPGRIRATQGETRLTLIIREWTVE